MQHACRLQPITVTFHFKYKWKNCFIIWWDNFVTDQWKQIPALLSHDRPPQSRDVDQYLVFAILRPFSHRRSNKKRETALWNHRQGTMREPSHRKQLNEKCFIYSCDKRSVQVATLPFRCVTGLNCIGERSCAIISMKQRGKSGSPGRSNWLTDSIECCVPQPVAVANIWNHENSQ